MITTPYPDEISIEADGSDDPESLALPGSQREILTKADDRQIDYLRQQRNILKGVGHLVSGDATARHTLNTQENRTHSSKSRWQ